MLTQRFVRKSVITTVIAIVAVSTACEAAKKSPGAVESPLPPVAQTPPTTSTSTDGTTHVSTEDSNPNNLALWEHVKPIFDKRCASCHNATAPKAKLSLVNYPFSTDAAKNKQHLSDIMARIHDEESPMPPKGLLASEELSLIDKWAKDGFLIEAPKNVGVTVNSSPTPVPQNEPTPGVEPTGAPTPVVDSTPGVEPTPASTVVSFVTHIQPIIASACVECHNTDGASKDLDLSVWPFVQDDKPQEVILTKVAAKLFHATKPMPPKFYDVQLSNEQKGLFVKWQEENFLYNVINDNEPVVTPTVAPTAVPTPTQPAGEETPFDTIVFLEFCSAQNAGTLSLGEARTMSLLPSASLPCAERAIALAKLKNLTMFDPGTGVATPLDLKPLRAFRQINALTIERLPLVSIAPLEGLPLQKLSLRKTGLLSAYESQVGGMNLLANSLAKLPKLQELGLVQESASNLTFIAALPNLQKIDVRMNGMLQEDIKNILPTAEWKL